MGDQANLLAIHTLEDLKSAMNRFAGEAGPVLTAVELEIQQTFEWLQERQAFWRREVQRRQEMLMQAQRALAACQASGYYDSRTGQTYVPNCSGYEDALLQARLRLRAAEDELRNVREWTRLVQRSATDYQAQARRLSAALYEGIPRAAALLERSAAILNSYVSMAAPAASEPPSTSSTYTALESIGLAVAAVLGIKVEPAGATAGGGPETAGGVERERGLESVEGGGGGIERG